MSDRSASLLTFDYGVIQAEETEQNLTRRNDRLVAVAAQSRDQQDVHDLDQISSNLVAEIEHFFISYAQIEGKEFRPIGRFDSQHAKKLVENGIKQFQKVKGKP